MFICYICIEAKIKIYVWRYDGQAAGMKQQMDEVKNRLNNIIVEGTAENGAVKVTATGNKQVKNISINEALLKDKEELEDLLVIAVNRALEEADKVHEKEMQFAAKGLFPGMPLWVYASHNVHSWTF